jgi:hypothetical protein
MKKTEDIRYNIKLALLNYRDLCAFLDSAVDGIDYTFNCGKVSARSEAIGIAHLNTGVYKAHIDNTLQTYKQLCELDGNTRPFDVVMRKFIEPICGDTKSASPVTNDAIAKHFGVSVDTIKRDIKKAFPRLRVIFFGELGLKQ